MPHYDYDPDDPNAPQPMDLTDEDDSYDDEDLIRCPSCGRMVHGLAAVCPNCGEWFVSDSPATQRSRGWFWPLMVALLLLVILVLWAGLRV